ncbi:MAG: NUDIX domain-containing protein [Nanoarchaeota archaeon]
MVRIRRRGTAIVETSKGILVASGRKKIFLLPGGGAEKWESRRKATIRELKEETGLKAVSWKFLFYHKGFVHKSHGGGHFKDIHKVFLIKAIGNPKPNHHDVKHIAYWKPDSNIKISRTTQTIIEKYLREYKK